MAGTRAYRETLDQPALSALFDLHEARTSPSFDKMWRDVCGLLEQLAPSTPSDGGG